MGAGKEKIKEEQAMNATYMWLLIAAAAFIIEILTVQLLTIWFIVGSVVAMVVAQFTDVMWIQILAFILSSAFTFIMCYPMLKKIITQKHVKTNLDAVVGKTALVVEEINNILGKGRVIESGVYWTARSVDDGVIKAGTTVRIKEISGAKLIVEVIDQQNDQ